MSPRKKDHEASEEKRRTILLAVEKIVAEKGVLGVTSKSVAQTAGISHGLLHYYFANKDEMMLAMIRFNTERFMLVFGEMFRTMKPGDDAVGDIVAGYRRMHAESAEFFNVFAECWPLLWTNKTMHDGFTRIFMEFRDGVQEFIETLIRNNVVKPKMGVFELSTLVCALSDGMEVQFRINPALVDNDAIWAGYESALRALLAE